MTASAPEFDRNGAARTRVGIWDELDASSDTLAVVAKRGHISVDGSGSPFRPAAEAPDGTRVYLGTFRGSDAVTRPVELRIIDDAGGNWMGVREMVGHADAATSELAITAIALANWHTAQRHCPGCGHGLHPEQAGWVLSCSECGTQVWPRTDPAVIVLVHDDDGRVLLGSNAAWEQQRYSLLAGFVEPGESLEAAVVREIEEESGVRVHSPTYFGSQGWPFPASLMVGFSATALPGELIPDGEEILDVRWFDRAALAAGEILLPRRGSLARHMLEDWFGGPLPESHGSR